jgi:hypothetical protein
MEESQVDDQESALAEVEVFMEDTTSAWFGIEPIRMDLGVIRFGAWQIRPAPRPRSAGEAYVVRVTAEFRPAPLAPRPMWWEAGFDLDGAIVHDALPRLVRSDETVRSYDLTPDLTFAVAPDGPLPVGPVPAAVDVTGLGTSRLRWRYTSTRADGPAPGPRTGWMVLLTAPGVHVISVRAVAICQPAPVDSRGFTAGSEAVRRTIELPRRTASTADTRLC